MSRILQATIVALTLAAWIQVPPSVVQAAPRSNLWERWLAHDPLSRVVVDHGAWDRFLRRHVLRGPDGIARIAYQTVPAGDRGALKNYIDRLSDAPVSRYGRGEQFAYWINLYNALTVNLVLDSYPVASIRDIDISPGLFADGPWGRKLVTVEGIALSLNDIEHRILRPIWRDPRIHYAVNCAAVGCPNLIPAAFTVTNSEALLEAAARAYVNHPRGARMAGGKLVLSRLYRWFVADFGGEAGIIAHVKSYADPGLAKAIGNLQRFSTGGYDWSLNDASYGISQAEASAP